MSIEVSPALDYSPKEISSGSYVQRLVNPENGQPTLSLNSTTNTDFLLPNQVINLARSYLNFNVLISDTNSNTASRWNHAHNGFLAPIDGIVLSTASGVKLVEMNNIPEYTKVAWRPQTNYEEFMTFPCHSNNEATVALTTQPGQLFNRIRAPNAGFVPARGATGTLAKAIVDAADVAALKAAFAAYFGASAAAETSDATNAEYRNSSYHISAEDGTAQVAASDDYSAVANYIATETKTAANTVAPAQGAGALGVRVQLPLKMIYGSLLAVDKDLYFGEQLRLTIRWNQGAKFGFESATSVSSVAVASTDLLENPILSTVQLRVAVEVNDAVAQGIKSRVMNEGISMNVPFTFAHKAVGDPQASGTATIIRKLNRGFGAKLLRVLVGVYSNVQSGARYCNNYNLSSAKWVSYRTLLDSRPIQDDTLLMSDMSAYQYHADKLKGSCLRDFRDWAQCPTIIEDFSGVLKSKDYPENDTANSGLDLSTEREFALQLTNGTATSLNVYLFAVCQKKLEIDKNGIRLM